MYGWRLPICYLMNCIISLIMTVHFSPDLSITFGESFTSSFSTIFCLNMYGPLSEKKENT